ncbi:MAG: nucleotidyltransferase [Spirochaetaceae bacterium]|nr:MAG: nucleotidyltransferase [Spirochaetaceae bacterium]
MEAAVKKILNLILENKQLLKAQGVEKIGIFGSYARGDFTSDSDLDIVVVFLKGRKTMKSYMDVYDIIETTTGKKVDLLTIEAISPFIKPYIEKEIVYEKL